jgi:hypothetical protein
MRTGLEFTSRGRTRRVLFATVTLIAVFAVASYIGFLTVERSTLVDGPTVRVSFLGELMGNAVAIETDQGRNVVLDPPDLAENKPFYSYLDKRSFRDVVVVISRLDSRAVHIIRAFAKSRGVDAVIYPEPVSLDIDAKHCVAELAKVCRAVPVVSGDTVQLSQKCQLKALGPLHRQGEASVDLLVAKFIYGSVSFLLASRITPTQEAVMVKSGLDIMSNVLQVPNGGRYASSSLELLAAVRPESCVLSRGSRLGLPSRSVLARLDPVNTGADLWRTDEMGVVQFISDGKDIVVKTGD